MSGRKYYVDMDWKVRVRLRVLNELYFIIPKKYSKTKDWLNDKWKEVYKSHGGIL